MTRSTEWYMVSLRRGTLGFLPSWAIACKVPEFASRQPHLMIVRRQLKTDTPYSAKQR